MTAVPEFRPSGRLELTWTNKNQKLLSHEDGSYEWTVPGDYRTSEVRLLHDVTTVGKTHDSAERAKDNLLIRGDALHALTSLAQLPEFAQHYVGKVKLVYIDPPFNRGQAFVHYDDALEHSVWLTMMRDRLEQIQTLLADDGSIWLHLDDVESHRARLVLDEVFGPKNFVAEIAWRSTDSSSNNAKGFAKDHNTILIYSKLPKWRPKHLPDSSKSGHYSNPDNNPRGPWYDGRDVQNPKLRPNLMYDVVSPSGNVIKHPNNGWRWERETLEAKLASGELFFNENETAIKRISFLWEQDGLPPSDIWFNVAETGSSRGAKNHLKNLFPGVLTPDLFDTPKPEQLMRKIIELSTEPGELVLDCFAGSGTTAAVAHKMGRRWATVEWQHSTIETYTMPRLAKVVEGTDAGGITETTTVEALGDLPNDVTAASAKAALGVLDKLLEHGTFDDLGLLRSIKKYGTFVANPKRPELPAEELTEQTDQEMLRTVFSAVRKAGKTKNVTTKNWHGGGSFRVLDVGPSMFEIEDRQVLLAHWAAGDALGEAVAGQYGFSYLKESPFCGRKGKQRLAVIDGLVNDPVVDFLLDWLDEGELLIVFGTGIDPESANRLADLRRGSTLKKIPDSIISSYRRTRRRSAGLNWASHSLQMQGADL